MDDVVVGGLGGEHDDGLIAVALADLVTDVETAHAGQHDVEKHQIVLPAERPAESVGPFSTAVDVEAVEDEYVLETRADRDLVLDDQNSALSAHALIG